MKLYRNPKDGKTYTKEQAIGIIASTLEAAIISPNIDDDFLVQLGSFEIVELQDEDKPSPGLYLLKIRRNELLEQTDWIPKGDHQLSPSVKGQYIAWRKLLRQIFYLCDGEIKDIPQPPAIDKGKPKTSLLKHITQEQFEGIRNYKTRDGKWLDFLDNWEKVSFTTNKEAVELLLIAYTGMTLNEIIDIV